jgi:peptidyl-prolyl cis-trans isomerase C
VISRQTARVSSPRRAASAAFCLGLTAGLVVATPFVAFAQTTKPAAQADSTIVAKVNGKSVTEGDLKLADAELGQEIANVPPDTRRQLLLEYMIENITFADAAEAAKLDKTPDFDARMAHAKRRLLRDVYFDTAVRGAIKDSEAQAFYDEQVKTIKPQDEANARHILVDKKELADEIAGKLKAGGDFAALAKEHSKDPGSKDNGGSLGFFGKGQMVPQFEETAFKLGKGEVSAPVQSQFGWHIIKLDDKRTRAAPPFEGVKERIMQSLIGQKGQTIATDLRAKAKLEIIDPDLNKAMTAIKPADAPKKP